MSQKESLSTSAAVAAKSSATSSNYSLQVIGIFALTVTLYFVCYTLHPTVKGFLPPMETNLLSTPCVLEKWRNQRSIDTFTSLKCELSTTRSEKVCVQQSQSHRDFYSDWTAMQRIFQCDTYFDVYPNVGSKNVTREEMEFPIAFALIVHSQVPLFEALMAAIFRPHNSYCVFIDAKAEPGFKITIRELLNCYKRKFQNSTILVIDKDAHPIYWAHISMLMGDLQCIKLLLKENSQWRYVINQPGTSFPIVPMPQLTRMLASFKRPCSSNQEGCWLDSIHSTLQPRFDTRYTFRHELRETGALQNWYPIVALPSFDQLEPPPFNLTIYKGHKDAAISRQTAQFFLHSQLGQGFLDWLHKGVGYPEEFFFATMRRVSQRLYREENKVVQDHSTDFFEEGTNGLCCRYSIWHADRQNLTICPGRTIRFMCHLSSPELAMVYAKDNPCIFANKFSLDVEGGADAVKCIHQHLVQES